MARGRSKLVATRSEPAVVAPSCSAVGLTSMPRSRSDDIGALDSSGKRSDDTAGLDSDDLPDPFSDIFSSTPITTDDAARSVTAGRGAKKKRRRIDEVEPDEPITEYPADCLAFYKSSRRWWPARVLSFEQSKGYKVEYCDEEGRVRWQARCDIAVPDFDERFTTVPLGEIKITQTVSDTALEETLKTLHPRMEAILRGSYPSTAATHAAFLQANATQREFMAKHAHMHCDDDRAAIISKHCRAFLQNWLQVAGDASQQMRNFDDIARLHYTTALLTPTTLELLHIPDEPSLDVADPEAVVAAHTAAQLALASSLYAIGARIRARRSLELASMGKGSSNGHAVG